MLYKIEYINIVNNPLINNDNFNKDKINEFFEIKKIEGAKSHIELLNIDKLENISKEKLYKLEGKFIEFILHSRYNKCKVKLCKKYFFKLVL